MKRKVFVVPAFGSGDSQIRMMFHRFRGDIYELVPDGEDADLFVFCGGSDVNPALYGQSVHETTHYDEMRDEIERSHYLDALERGIPMVGICRGAQFLHVMNGGSLFQNVDGHGGTHPVHMYGKLLPLDVSSTHHQMMRITNDIKDNLMLLAYAHKSKIREYMSGENDYKPYQITNMATEWDDPEAVWWGETNCLCVQWHPEYALSVHSYLPCMEAFFHLLENFTFASQADDGDDAEEGVVIDEH